MLFKALLAAVILFSLNIYVVLRTTARWPWAQQHTILVLVLAAMFLGVQLLAPFGDHLFLPALREQSAWGQSLAEAIDWVSYLALGIITCLFVYMVVADIVFIIWNKLPVTPPVDLDRRTLLTLGGLTAGGTLLGVGQVLAGPQIREVEIPLANLPVSFDGFRIVQISDLHTGPTIGRDYVEKVVAMANGLKPDMLALTGDFVDGEIEELKDDLAPLAQLSAPYGSFYITGNHEYYWGADAWIAHFASLGATPLLNEHRILHKGNEQLLIAGVTDYSTRHMQGAHAFSPSRAADGAPKDLVKILLAHQPASYDEAAKAGFDLQLSGHTHAGQYFPFTFFIGLFQRYYKGLNRHDNMWVYVNRGTGYWGPPLRTLMQSEITQITLRRMQA